MLKGLEVYENKRIFAKNIRVVPHRSGYSTLKNTLGLFPLPMAGHSYPSGEQ